jgi:hypothetical protein
VQGYRQVTDAEGRRTTTEAPHDYEVEFWTVFRPTTVVPRPHAYVIPLSCSGIVRRLAQHGIAVRQLEQDTELNVESYRITQIQRASESYQGHSMQQLTVTRQAERRPIEAGSWVVELRQPLNNLIVHLLEPQGVDSFAAWNLFEPELQAEQEYPILRVAQPLAGPRE